jgi:serine/threonine protein kinase/Tol biopolymer transport system component
VTAIGAGGMGEVYRARDVRLNRDVALKVLPEAFSLDPDRVARFKREAQVLASLNHPNIAVIHGFEESDPTPPAPAGDRECSSPLSAIVLELVDGPTLADRIAQRPFALDELVPIARQIAEALEAAHEQGIVHRDLKPANIKVRADGTVKVLDFGLAKALEPMTTPADPMESPTITSPAATKMGMILGTAAYMSPEQARGHAVDRGADIWAFGCVLFEMLTGARAFPGTDTTETIAAILRAEPEWSRLPAETPEGIHRVLRRCLEKNRKRRLADIRDARLEIEDAHTHSPPLNSAAPNRSRRVERLAWTAALAIVALAAATAMLRGGRSEPAAVHPESHVEIDTPPTTDLTSFAISPDGEKVAYVALSDGLPQLWLRLMTTGVARPLRGTEGASHPFWSPDSKSIGFFTSEKLFRLDIEGGAPRPIVSAAVGTGGTWNRDGVIVFAPVPDAPVVRVSADGGEATLLPGASRAAPGGQRFPHFLPDGRHFIYYVAESRGVFVGEIDKPERRRLFDADAAAVFVPPAEILFARDGKLLSQGFDTERLEVTGEPTSIVEAVTIDARGIAAVSASNTGSLVYRKGATHGQRRLRWFNRSGQELATAGDPDSAYPMNLSLSPDGRRVAFSRSTEGGNTDIWLLDIARTVLSRFTFDPTPEIVPSWSPDGSRIIYSKISKPGVFALYQKGTDAGSKETILVQTDKPAILLDLSRDGRHVLFRMIDPKMGWDIWAKKQGEDEPPFPVAQTAFDERTAQFSPNGQWIAYESNESGRFEVYVQSFPTPAAKLLVSTKGGSQMRWRADGRELFYVAADGRLMAVPVGSPSAGGTIELGTPAPLFAARIESSVQGGIAHAYAVTADGQRFLMSTFTEQTAPIALILNRRAPRAAARSDR